MIQHKCNFCLIDLNGDPFFSDSQQKNKICRRCSLKSTESFIEANLGGIMLFWLEEMKYRFFKNKRKKRICYLPKTLRNQILEKYKFTCQKCGVNKDLSIDHIKPVKHGGTDEAENLTILCKICNAKKGAKYD